MTPDRYTTARHLVRAGVRQGGQVRMVLGDNRIVVGTVIGMRVVAYGVRPLAMGAHDHATELVVRQDGGPSMRYKIRLLASIEPA